MLCFSVHVGLLFSQNNSIFFFSLDLLVKRKCLCLFFFPLEQLIRGYSTSPTAHTDNEGFQDHHWAARRKEPGKSDKDQVRVESLILDFVLNANQHSSFAGVG